MAPNRGRPLLSIPDRPVPPLFYFSRSSGYRTSSYTNRQPLTNRNQDILRQPAGSMLPTLIRKLKAIIKTIHHLQNVTPTPEKPEPRMLFGMTETLA